MSEFNTFLYGEKYPIVRWIENEEIEFWIEPNYEYQECPCCGKKSYKVHDIHKRKIQDTPIHNKNVFININVREFRCQNKKCKQKTFTEEIPFAGKNQVRTYALTEYILIHAIYMSSNSTSLILSFLGVNISADTVDNILKKVNIKDNFDVEKIGIDDVALRKGLNYATAIYDLENHHLIALLKGREKEDIIPWLKAHPKIKIVARDRASAYTEAVNEILPEAVQVADKFHLFENLLKYLKNMFYKEIPDKIVIKEGKVIDKKAKKVIKELANIDKAILNNLNYDNSPPIDENGKEIEYINLQYYVNDDIYKIHEKNRLKKYNDILEIRKDKNLSINELIDKYKYCKKTILKYLKMTDEEVEKIKFKKTYQKKNKTEFCNFKNIVYKMLADNQSYEYIIAYCLEQGYKGNLTTLKGDIHKIAVNNGFTGTTFNRYNKYEYNYDETIITRYELLKYLLTLDVNKIKNPKIDENIDELSQTFPIVNIIKNIFQDFHNVMFSKNENMLDEFIINYQTYIPSFCNGLKKDIAAIRNAISHTINSGFVEGNNNKFKLIKRIVYGKQKLVNLFKRCYLAFTSTLDDLSLLKSVIDSISEK